MKKLILAATLAAGLGAALPAAAQTWNDHGRHGGFGREDALAMRIERGLRSGSLTEREARGLTRELQRIEDAEHRYRRDGYLSQRERMVINQRLADLGARIRAERFDRERSRDFGSGYGRGGFGGYR